MKPIITTERTDLYIQNRDLLDKNISYYERNALFLKPWEPKRSIDYFTRESFLDRLEKAEREFSEGRAVQMAALDRQNGEIAGIANFTGIIRGPFQACFLGYSLSESFQGKGFMTEILSASIKYIFKEIKLHRVIANYMPANERSGRLLEKLGFEREGLARDYLQINGRWEDHILTALINPLRRPIEP